MKTNERVEVWVHHSWSWPYLEVSGQVHVHAAPEAVWTLSRREKSLDPAGNWIAAVEPVTCRHTEWAILVPTAEELELMPTFMNVFNQVSFFIQREKQCPLFYRPNNTVPCKYFASAVTYLCDGGRECDMKCRLALEYNKFHSHSRMRSTIISK
jgi:hypothetical protein